MTEGQIASPPRRAQLLLITLVAGVVATVLTLLVVLPAEFGRDPTGFGRLTGLDKLAPQHEEVIEIAAGPTAPAQFQNAPFRSDTIEIPLVAKGDKTGKNELEFKVRMKTGQTLVYSWEVDGAGEAEFYFDLHAETPAPNVKVVEFKKATGNRSHGSLTAPIDAVHGWYWRNDAGAPVTVRLKLSGFYELIPPGESGNKSGIVPVSTGP